MSTSLSPLLAPMLSSAAMRAICDDAAYLQHMLDFEAALARAEAATGIIPADAADAIAKACKADTKFDPGALAEARDAIRQSRHPPRQGAHLQRRQGLS